jgi:hypothetical protein
MIAPAPRSCGIPAFALRLFACTVVLTATLCASVPAPSYAGLYDSDATSIKSGPILDRDYWRAKWDSMRLDDAIKERQPEGAILIAVIGQIQLLDELIQKYPNDQDLKDWKAHAEDIKGKIDPNANRSDSFKDGCLWGERNYQEAYVNYNYAKLAIQQQNWDAAKDGLNYAQQNFTILQERIKNNDRVSAWPPGAADWVTTTAPELAKMQEQVNAKLK